jgi:hypothetical protein
MEHKRQFLICKKEFSYPNFNYIELHSDFLLYYHIDLNISLSDCKKNILIGSAFKSIEGTISKDLNDMTSANYIDMTSNWSGRWIAIIDNKLHIDSGGLLGCYYGMKEGSSIVSSSIALLNECCSFEKETDFKDIKHGNAMNWFPPPLTKFKGVRKLLVGQCINVEKGTIEQKPKTINKFKKLPQKEIYEILAIRLKKIINNISKIYGDEVYLPLTSGYDSRTILAALLNNKASFSAFLFEHENISNADRKTPLILANKFNFSFFFIRRTNTFNKERYNEYIENSSGQAADAGSLFHTYNQYEPLDNKSKNKKKVILRGGIWEVGRDFYPTIDNSLSLDEDILISLKSRFPILSESKLHEKSIKLWITHAQETHSNLRFRDRFYLEQRVSGWLASLEQASDLTNFERVNPANCQDIIDLLSLTELNPQLQIMRELQPKLLKTPFNSRSLKESLKKLYHYILKWSN